MNLFKTKKTDHWALERFTIGFVVLSALMVIVLIYSFCMYTVAQANIISNKSMYSTTFTLSKTQTTGSVQGVYTGKDHKKAFVLLKFDNVDSMSTDANNYQAFLTGADVDQNSTYIQSAPAGSIYVFGTTGYMGVYLANNEGFPQQILDLTIRANKQLVDNQDSATMGQNQDESFAKYDQFKIYFNPAGADAKKIKCLNGSQIPSKLDLFKQTVVNSQMHQIKKDLNGKLAKLKADISQIQEFSQRLDKTHGVKLVAPPAIIAGDSIEQDDKTGKYDVKFKTTVAGGYNFDWQTNKNPLDMLIRQQHNKNMTYDQYFAMKSQQRKDDDSSNSEFDTTNIQWVLKDETPVEDLNTGSDTGRYVTINNDIQSLMNAWSTYYGDKKTYQTTDLETLLALQAQTKQVKQITSVNTHKKAVMLY